MYKPYLSSLYKEAEQYPIVNELVSLFLRLFFFSIISLQVGRYSWILAYA